MTGARIHVVVGPDRHGVTEHSAALAAAVGAPVLRVPHHAGLDDALGDLSPGAPVHLGFTDRIWGRSPATAAEALSGLSRGGAGRDVTVTLHDLPQASDGEASFRRRAECYRAVADVAGGIVVSSGHEERLLVEAGSDRGALVIPLPVPQLPASTEVALDGLDRSVVLFGFVYPGKGHAETIRALGHLRGRPLPRRLVALGECSDGHEELADDLTRLGARNDVWFEKSGYVPAGRLAADLGVAAVPVAPHRHVSASGSIAAWIAAGRKPLVADNRYTRELAARWPGTATLVPDDGWAVAIATAYDAPATTYVEEPPRWGWTEVAAGYRRFWSAQERNGDKTW